MAPVAGLGAVTVGLRNGSEITEFEQGLQQLLATSLKLGLRGTPGDMGTLLSQL